MARPRRACCRSSALTPTNLGSRISADGKWLATSSEDKTVKIWRLTEK